MWITLFVARAQETTVLLDGEVPDDALEHFRLPFEVPAGTVEIEVRHDDLSEANILDWGLDDPSGWRGWGGGNVEPAVVNALAASRSYMPGPVAAGTWQVVVGKAQILETPALYHVEIVLRETATLAPQTRRPYVPAEPLSAEARWYAGDFHVHSNESGDATATLDEIADLARSRGLDFVVVTDHNTVSHLDQIVDAQARHPDLLLIPGTEFTTYAGHANAFGVRGWVDHKIGQPGVTIESAAAAYALQGALLSINHPELDLGDVCIGCAWTQAVPVDHLAGMEIGTGGWDKTAVFTERSIARWDALADDGVRLAAIGGSDDHRAGTDTGVFASPIGNPTTMVWAESLSEAAILDGVAAGRTVVKLQGPEDPMADVVLDGLHVSATVTGGVGADLVWIEDGSSSERTPIDADPFTAGFDLGADTVRVRAEVQFGGDPRTVTSHLWVAPPEVPDDGKGCGCTSAGGSGWLVIVGFFVLGRRTSASR